jgi:hypothetical protein
MSIEKSNLGDTSVASVTRGAGSDETLGVEGYYTVRCYGADGVLKWEDVAPNLVTAVGKQDLFNYYFGATSNGGTASGSNYLGLLSGTTTYTAADTMSSHAWTEVGGTNAPAYTGNRQSPVWTTASSSGTTPSNVTTKTAPALTFAMTSSGTVAGCFINSGSGASATKDTTTGVLYSAGSFTGGTKTVANGDSLAVTYSTTATS